MRPPLLEMVVRTPELDRARYPHLSHLKYPFGGTMGTGVRSAGARNYAGWDLHAKPGTPAFAVADGNVVHTGVMHGYGNVLPLEFQFQGHTLYGLYDHLSLARVHSGKHTGTQVKEGDSVGFTGTTGNAVAVGEPPHLHFEVWTKRNVGPFLDGRISPGVHITIWTTACPLGT